MADPERDVRLGVAPLDIFPVGAMPAPMSKLEDFIAAKKIDPRRILAASKRVERLGAEDRAIQLARRQVRAGATDETLKEKAGEKPKSGRPVTPGTLRMALAGRPISGPAKTRITRAVNHVLVAKKQGEVDLRELFS